MLITQKLPNSSEFRGQGFAWKVFSELIRWPFSQVDCLRALIGYFPIVFRRIISIGWILGQFKNLGGLLIFKHVPS